MVEFVFFKEHLVPEVIGTPVVIGKFMFLRDSVNVSNVNKISLEDDEDIVEIAKGKSEIVHLSNISDRLARIALDDGELKVSYFSVEPKLKLSSPLSPKNITSQKKYDNADEYSSTTPALIWRLGKKKGPMCPSSF
ncbi:hypothetical protein L596_013675 [Steinernema carpocapsae]|uniref:Uncharacterized protein n=1 Tax=Steinernema carpocapsae TaxID=34508 RepID=A0A4U5P0X0_STECR|nr:hypothetical protein L596_013675 [Steinernema carpocapsae]